MANTPSTESKELALIEKVELRIALTNSDAKLESVLNVYLAPLLLKLASEHISVRNKVISICQHINTRTKPQNVRLPVAALLKQFKDNSQTPLIRHFDLLYVQQGISRLATAERGELFPLLARGIASDTTTSALHGASLFNLLLGSLGTYQLPPKASKEDGELRAKLEIEDDDIKFLSFWLGKLLLLRLAATTATTCPGLSADEYSFLTLQGKADTWARVSESSTGIKNLTEAKLTALKVLSSGLFNDAERFLPTLFASADQNSKISDVAEDLMKHTLPNVNLDDVTIVNDLYDVYFGGFTSGNQALSTVVTPAQIPVRLKVLSMLSKSVTSTKFPAKIIRIVERDLASGQTPRSDREGTKLRSTIISFLSFVAGRASPEDLDAIGQAVIGILKDFVEYQVDDPRSSDVKSIRGRSYEVIGLLAGANGKTLMEPDLALLRWLFKSLGTESDKDVVVSIDEALSGALRSFQEHVIPGVLQPLRELLLRNMQETSRNARNVRFASVRFANRCLAYSDVVARWIDMIAVAQTSGESHETVEEAKKGLDPYTYQLFSTSHHQTLSQEHSDPAFNSPGLFPRFTELVEYIFVNRSVAADNKHTTALAVSYCRQTLIAEALIDYGVKIEVDAEWERKLATAITENLGAIKAVRTYLKSMTDDESGRATFFRFWSAALRGMDMDETRSKMTCARVVVELCTLSPHTVLGEMAPHFNMIDDALLSNDVDVRGLAAHAYGLLASHLTTGSEVLKSSLDALFEKIEAWKDAIGADLNRVHGAVLALAYFISHRSEQSPDDNNVDRILQRFLPLLFDMLENCSDLLLQDACYLALGQLCLFFVISPKQIAEHMSLSTLISNLSKKAKTGNEKAIAVIGHLSMIIDEHDGSDLLRQLADEIYALHEVRQAETQFAVGEALSCLACGWESKGLVAKLDRDGPVPVGPKRTKAMTPLLDRVIADCSTTKPSLKKASVIWLLCFIQFCGDRQEVQDRLREFQAAFKRCLSDRDELVQESASRGLGLVYEKGNRDLKDDLVRDLVGSFSSNRADLSGTVTEETQLFESGALPTGDGSITTYKDIMSLASEVGDSSLVYRFMSLASNNAIWSTRAAFGRFGLSSVLSDSSVDGYLAANPKLYPKLYRYRFDPNGNVRQSMNAIWIALVKNPAETIETHFEAIIEDLLASIVNREWRVRQASCAAIADLVQGRKLEKIRPYLDRIWSLSFKVLDDIKDSVRTAAAGLARVMTGTLLRSLETSEGSTNTAGEMLKHVLPFLLSTSGLESSAKDVQTLSLDTLLQVIKKAKGKTLRPFIPELIERLLGLLSSLESQMINYLHLNASKYNVTEQQIDDQRLSAIRMSPLMEAIERCLDLLDEDTMGKLSPRLQSAMKTAVGLPSKVGCSRVLVTLSTRQNFIFRPYSDQFLKILEKQIFDRNETVSSSYAGAMGYVARGATDEQLLQTANFAKGLYFVSDNDRQRIISGEIVHAIAKHSTDRFAALAADFLPLVYIALHDENTQVKEVFKEAWDENVGGTRAVSLYLTEIVALVTLNLKSARWSLKHAAALSIADTTTSICSSRGEITEADGEMLWPAIKIAMAEKTWDGKEKVLDGFVAFVRSGEKFWKPREEVASDIVEIALREARRRNEAYRQYAIPSLGKIAEVMQDVEMFDAVFEITRPVMEELTSTDAEAMDVDGATDGSDREAIRRRTIAGVIEAQFCGIKTVVEDVVEVEAQKPRDLAILTQMTRTLELTRRASCAEPGTLIQSAIYSSSKRLCERLTRVPNLASSLFAQVEVDGAIQRQFANLLLEPHNALSEALRLQRSDALSALAKALKSCRLVDSQLLEGVRIMECNEISSAVRENLAQAHQLLQRP